MPADQHQCFRVTPEELPEEAVIFGCTAAAMREVHGKVQKPIRSDLPVLHQGERGAIVLGDEAPIIEELPRKTAVAGGTNRSAESTLPLSVEKARILWVSRVSRRRWLKMAEDLKRSYRSSLYRLRILGGLPRPRSRKRFPRSE